MPQEARGCGRTRQTSAALWHRRDEAVAWGGNHLGARNLLTASAQTQAQGRNPSSSAELSPVSPTPQSTCRWCHTLLITRAHRPWPSSAAEQQAFLPGQTTLLTAPTSLRRGELGNSTFKAVCPGKPWPQYCLHQSPNAGKRSAFLHFFQAVSK